MNTEPPDRWRDRHPMLVFIGVLALCVAFPFVYNGLLAAFH